MRMRWTRTQGLSLPPAPEMHKLLRRIESYFKNRHIYGPGVEESVSKKLMIRIERVMKKADGETVDEE